jgi:hypothetical protein
MECRTGSKKQEWPGKKKKKEEPTMENITAYGSAAKWKNLQA